MSHHRDNDLQASDSDTNSGMAKAQLRAEYKQLLNDMKFIDVNTYSLDCPPTDLHHAAGYNQGVDQCRAIILKRIESHNG